MANTFKFGNGNWAVKEDYALAYNDENGNFKPLPFDFTRASTATRVNKNGLVETVPSGKPRIDFLNNTSGHLLLEPSRTNYVPRSVFDAAVPTGWSVGFGTGTYEHELTTFMGQPAVKHTQLTSGRSFLQYGFSFLASTTYTCSFYVDLANCGDIRSAETIVNIILDDDTGQTSVTFGEIDQDTGFASFTFTTGTDTFGYIRMGFGCASTSDETNKPFVFSMPQVEIGSYATSYIPTEGSSVTRSAEEANGAGNSTVFNDSEGVLYAEIAALANDLTYRLLSISNGGSSDRVFMGYKNTSNELYFLAGNVIETISQTVTDNIKVAFKYKSGDSSIYINGTEAETSAGTMSLSGMNEFAFDSGTGSPFYGKIKEVRVYDTALSDSELQALTS